MSALHKKMVALTKHMLELHKSSPRPPQDKEGVRRVPGKPLGIMKIEHSADRAIEGNTGEKVILPC